MTVAAESRVLPLIDLSHEQISDMLGGRAIGAVEPVLGGLVNTMYKITPAGGGEALVVRMYARGRRACEHALGLFTRLGYTLPVPEILYADYEGTRFSYPYVVYRWIEGTRLNECRKTVSPAAFQTLAEPLGRLLAGVAAFTGTHPSPTLAARFAAAEDQLRRGRARNRLGATLADALAKKLASNFARIDAAQPSRGIVHGDLGGRNILVAPVAGQPETWRITGLIDWEDAFSGSCLWDVGSLYRYGERYQQARFAAGYRAAGGQLPDGWYGLARLLDSVQLTGMLDGEKETPEVYEELRALVEIVVNEAC